METKEMERRATLLLHQGKEAASRGDTDGAMMCLEELRRRLGCRGPRITREPAWVDWSKRDAFGFSIGTVDDFVCVGRCCNGASLPHASCHRSSRHSLELRRRSGPTWAVQVFWLSTHTAGGE
jgi:hypothetical protein